MIRIIAGGTERLDAMTETRRIAYQGSGPFLRTLVQALEDDGVAVTVRRDGPYVGQHREVQGMGSAVNATLVATGAAAAIQAAVSAFRQQVREDAQVLIQDKDSPPHTRGSHRA
jgi:hypothetical protein